MGSLSDITKKIIDDANARAKDIINRANDEANKIFAQAHSDVEKKHEEILHNAQTQAKISADRIVAAAELEGKKKVLSAKQAIIADAFSKAVSYIVRLEDEEYNKVISKMSEGAKGEIVNIPRDKEKGTGGGFVVKNGNIDLNYSLEALAKASKDRMEKEVVSILFD